ncbi:MAG: hypothetical protein ACYSWO_29335 [Planctomycetota bacterium]|jgi:hypothetical protein
MSDIRRRLKKAEEKLSINEKHTTVNVVYFGGGESPPDHTHGNTTTHYVAYEDILDAGDDRVKRLTANDVIGHFLKHVAGSVQKSANGVSGTSPGRNRVPSRALSSRVLREGRPGVPGKTGISCLRKYSGKLKSWCRPSAR